MLSQHFSVTCNWIFVKLTGNEDRHKISNEFRFGLGRTFHYGAIEHSHWMGKRVPPAFLSYYDFSLHQTYKDRHKISDEFAFWSYLTIQFGVTCPWVGKKGYLQLFSVTFEWIFVKLVGNEDRHKRSNDLEFRPDRFIHFGVIRLWTQIPPPRPTPPPHPFRPRPHPHPILI